MKICFKSAPRHEVKFGVYAVYTMLPVDSQAKPNLTDS